MNCTVRGLLWSKRLSRCKVNKSKSAQCRIVTLWILLRNAEICSRKTHSQREMCLSFWGYHPIGFKFLQSAVQIKWGKMHFRFSLCVCVCVTTSKPWLVFPLLSGCGRSQKSQNDTMMKHFKTKKAVCRRMKLSYMPSTFLSDDSKKKREKTTTTLWHKILDKVQVFGHVEKFEHLISHTPCIAALPQNRHNCN